ncbi:calcitonin receptor-like [Sarotherodon galilaeus]
MNDPIKTVAPALHPIKVHPKVKEPWEVLGMDLIGPLPETRLGNRYVLTMTDLFTKWVIAEPLKSKTAAEVSAIMTSKLYTFGMVRKIITDQGKEFVNQLNNSIFSMLNIKHAVSSAYHPQTNGQVLRNFERAQDTQRKTFGTRKRKQVRECVVQAGDDVLLSGDPKRRRTGDALLSQHQGPYTVASITPKGVATIVKGATCQKIHQLRGSFSWTTHMGLRNGRLIISMPVQEQSGRKTWNLFSPVWDFIPALNLTAWSPNWTLGPNFNPHLLPVLNLTSGFPKPSLNPLIRDKRGHFPPGEQSVSGVGARNGNRYGLCMEFGHLWWPTSQLELPLTPNPKPREAHKTHIDRHVGPA